MRTLLKIRDTESYDASEMTDGQLKDDWCLVSDWYSMHKDGKPIKFTEEQMLDLAGKALSETFTRGISTFTPSQMKKHSEELFWLTADSLVNRGLVVAESHIKRIIQGKKTLIIKPDKFKINTKEPLWLISRGNASAILQLKSVKELRLDQLADLAERHLVSEEERKQWWPDVDTFYAYDFNLLARFKSKETNVPEDSGTWPVNVKVKTMSVENMITDFLGLEEIKLQDKDDFKEIPGKYTDKDLLFYFNLMHDIYAKKLKGKRVELGGRVWSMEDILNYYVLIVREMSKRNLQTMRRSELDTDAAPLFGSGVQASYTKEDKEGSSTSKSIHKHNQCMLCNKAPDLECLWAEGKGHAWFCRKDFIEWSTKGDGKSDVNAVKEIFDGKASKHFTDNKNKNIWNAEKQELTKSEKSEVSKQKSPYLILPGEDKTYAYSWQHHYRGKSAHADFRLENEDKNSLIGWTIADAVSGAIDEPVETLSAAREWDKKDSAWKFDYKTGKVKERQTSAGTTAPAQLRVFKKALESKQWLDVEGVTAPFPAPGSTRQFKGVFTMLDGTPKFKNAKCEYGAQRSGVHEYFCSGGLIKGRILMRQLDPGTDGVAIWTMTQPADQTPIVLKAASGWMPPVGRSALPKSVRAEIPSEHQYWKASSEAEAKNIRDELVEAIKSKEVILDFEKLIVKLV